jgi:hypothetical protein
MVESERDTGSEDVQDRTKQEERTEAAAEHVADRPPTPEEEAAADENRLDPQVAEHEREMTRLGREQKGEGRID